MPDCSKCGRWFNGLDYLTKCQACRTKPLMCSVGIHGPRVFGDDLGERNARRGPGQRECEKCGQRWVARDEGPNGRYVLVWHEVAP